MAKRWPTMPLGSVMKLAMNPHSVVPVRSYSNLGIFSYARGLFRKPPIEGCKTSATTLYQVHSGQFIYSRLFAFEGAYAVVPDEFDGHFVSNEFPAFDPNHEVVLPGFLRWLFACPWVWAQLATGSTGMGDRRQRIHPDRIAEYLAPIPPLEEQCRIVNHLDRIERLMNERQSAIDAMGVEAEAMLSSTFEQLIEGAPLRQMAEVAPLVRRPVEIDPDTVYLDIGARSFGRGTFHKPGLIGGELTWQQLFKVRAGDVLISNIKAWEGAIAVAYPSDDHRFASHRYLTCVPVEGVVTAHFVCRYLLSRDGLAQVQSASPGSADRNRTLSQKGLMAIQVPVPSFEKQLWFDGLQAKVREIRAIREEASRDANALLPAMLHEIFGAGEA
jgi:type I restriction enzyme, S subunit